MSKDPYGQSRPLSGAATDETPEILATGDADITCLFVSMAKRHPDGDDANYLRWHTLDHRPEQQRLSSVRTSLRLVSTPECRAARMAGDAALDAIDHVQIYYFASLEGLQGFNELSIALRNAGRTPFVLPPVQRGVYRVGDCVAAPRVKIGADVLPWLPIKGAYLLLEEGKAKCDELSGFDGVAGIWSAQLVESAYGNTKDEQQLSVCFLDDDPVVVANRFINVLQERWSRRQISPLLAAPFYCVVPYEWERYLPGSDDA